MAEEQQVEEIMTAGEVAKLLRIHIRTVYGLAESGVIPGSRIGRGWRFNRRDILELISEKKKNGKRTRQ